MNLSSAAQVLSQSAQSVPSTSAASQQADFALPSRDEAIDMIVRARWWSPELTYKPEPLSTLCSLNSTEESGWLRTLLFPASKEASEQFDEHLTLSYILTVAEGKDLASDMATAWGMTIESAMKLRNKTVAAFSYYPIGGVLSNNPNHPITKEQKIDLLSKFPRGCLRSTWAFSDQERLVMTFLDAALHTQGCRHVKHVRSLFNCSAASINSNHKNLVRSLFAGCQPSPPLPLGWIEGIDQRTGLRFWVHVQTRATQFTRPLLPESAPAAAAGEGATTDTPNESVAATDDAPSATETANEPDEPIPATTIQQDDSAVATEEPAEPSPKSVAEVRKENVNNDAQQLKSPKKSGGKTSNQKRTRTPFANKSNVGTPSASKGKPAGILKDASFGVVKNKAKALFSSPNPAPKKKGAVMQPSNENSRISIQ